MGLTRYDQLIAQRRAAIESWAYAAKSRDFALAQKHAERIEELDSEVYYEGGAPISVSRLTDALEKA